jgi:hypothetical protein
VVASEQQLETAVVEPPTTMSWLHRRCWRCAPNDDVDEEARANARRFVRHRSVVARQVLVVSIFVEPTTPTTTLTTTMRRLSRLSMMTNRIDVDDDEAKPMQTPIRA